MSGLYFQTLFFKVKYCWVVPYSETPKFITSISFPLWKLKQLPKSSFNLNQNVSSKFTDLASANESPKIAILIEFLDLVISWFISLRPSLLMLISPLPSLVHVPELLGNKEKPLIESCLWNIGYSALKILKIISIKKKKKKN